MKELADTIFKLLSHRVFGNSVRDYLSTLMVILIGLMLVKLFNSLIVRRLRAWFRKTTTTWDDLFVATLENNVVPGLYVLIVFLGLRDLQMKEALRVGMRTLVTVIVTVFALRMLMTAVNHGIRSYWDRHSVNRSAAREKNLNGIITVAKIVVWMLGFILVLDNLGIKVTAFVAGLGITGIAVALAAQAILGDFFSYFVIFFDQPFEPGHIIKVDGFTGEVEHIGLKTTRLRSGDGEQVIFSNKFITDSRVQNFTRMSRRRVVFATELAHGTPVDSLRSVPGIIKDQFGRFQDVTFERSHFKAAGDYGLRFESSFVVETADFGRYMDVLHEANLGLQEAFAKAGLAFAFPTRVVHLRDGEGGIPGAGARPRDDREDREGPIKGANPTAPGESGIA